MRKGSHHTKETRDKLVAAWKHRPPFSEETKRRMSEATRGIPKSEEHKRKLSIQKLGSQNPSWKGGRRSNPQGYVFVLCKSHPNADRDGYIFEHRLVMERHIGRMLTRKEVVHHINGQTDDNRIENLALFTIAEHTSGHRRGILVPRSASRGRKVPEGRTW